MSGWEHGPRGFEHFDWLGPLFMGLFVVALIVGVVLMIRALSSRNTQHLALVHGAGGVTVPSLAQTPAQVVGRPSAALTVLEERFARGDINREEFHQRRNDLLSPPGAPNPSGTTTQTEPSDQ